MSRYRFAAFLAPAIAIASTLVALPVADSATKPEDGIVDASRLALPVPRTTGKLDAALARASGPVDVVVQLAGVPLAIANGENAHREGGRLGRAAQMTHSAELSRTQSALLTRIAALGGREIARLRIAYNAVIVRVDAAKLAEIARQPEVLTLRPVGEYRTSLEDTVPYIGASAAQQAGFDGRGVKVAVLDSGIDYTHRNLGGAGTRAAYEAAYGTGPADSRNTSLDGLFPTSKVVGGYDFVGEAWSGGADSPPLAPDPDPIDFDGHGTHVADIIGGRSADGSHVGVAPGVSLYAVKVCSAVSTACSGVALLQGMEFALDPNGDGSMDDAVDVINLSLGSPYGQKEDDLGFAAANAVRAGVIVVASAGNNGDRPYITSSPGSTPEVISVAQTRMPAAVAIPLRIDSPASIAGIYPNTATLDWAPIGPGVSGSVAYVGRGCRDDETTADIEPTDPYLADPAGRIALIDRGACAISVKVDRAAKAGATGVLIGLVDTGDAVTFAQGGGKVFVPTLVIIQSYANLIKAHVDAPVRVSITPANAVPLTGSMADSSSRGPGYSFNQIKPDIGAPGASISAVAGTGRGEAPFGGTSGAAPVVSGAAAILAQAYPQRSPAAIRSLLMNTADTQVFLNPAIRPGALAPITRIGAGEVRIDQALASSTAAWDAQQRTASLSFGYQPTYEKITVRRQVRVRNYDRKARSYRITTAFRYADDAASGAVALDVPAKILVPANDSRDFDVRVTIDPRRLPVWTLNGGARGGDGFRLEGVEFDGHISIADERDDIHLAWHVLPHRAAGVRAVRRQIPVSARRPGVLALVNQSGVLDGRVDVFSLLGTSPRIPRAALPGPGDNLAVVDLAAVGARLVGIGGGAYGLQFAVSTYGQRAHPAYPGGFEIDIDTNGDGEADWYVFNAEDGAFGSSGRTLIYVQEAGSTTASAYFYADADLDSANMILTVPLAALGLTSASQITFDVLAYDNYFTGSVTDAIRGLTCTPGLPRFAAAGPPGGTVRAGLTSALKVEAIDGGTVASPSQSGLLLLYRDALSGYEAEAIGVILLKPGK